MSRDPVDIGQAEPIFLFANSEGLTVHSYSEWRKIQSNLYAGMRDAYDWQGEWAVILPGSNVPEIFVVRGGKTERFPENDGVVYGTQEINIDGITSGITYSGRVDLLDV